MRVRTVAAAIAIGGLAAVVLAAQSASDGQEAAGQQQQERLRGAELTEAKELVAIADKAMKGSPTGGDASLGWHHHFLRGPAGLTYVPFTVAIDQTPGNAFRALAVYVRVTARGEVETSAERTRRQGFVGLSPGDVPVCAPGGAPAAHSAALRLHAGRQRSGAYPAEHISFTRSRPAEPDGRRVVQRAVAVPAGSYDLYLVVRERESSAPRGQLPRAARLKYELEVPDLSAGGLTMSSLILTQRVQTLRSLLSPEEQAERPYALGAVEIVPTLRTLLRPADTASVLFFVYEPELDAEGKPDVLVEYRFHRAADGGEQLEAELRPQLFSAETLPPAFDLRLGHELVPFEELPLASLPPGDYRLEVRVTDRRASQSLTRDLRFTIAPD